MAEGYEGMVHLLTEQVESLWATDLPDSEIRVKISSWAIGQALAYRASRGEESPLKPKLVSDELEEEV